MSYAIVFTGEIKPAFTKPQVIGNLCALFKKDGAYIEKLFSGKRVVIKRDLALDHAKQYLQALTNAGAVCELLDQSAADDGNTKQAESPAALSMATVGSTIVAPVAAQKAEIDTSRLSMSAAGETLVEQAPVEAIQINELQADLSPVGSSLGDKQVAKPADIDISKLSLSEPGELTSKT